MITILGELGGAQTAFIAELVTITLTDGTILRYTTGPKDITFSGNAFSSAGPYPLIGTIGWKVGVEVEVLKLELWALLTNLVESQAILSAIVQGLFDNASVRVERLFMPTYGDTTAGSVILFQGNVSDVPLADAIHAEMDVKSCKELLNIPLPYRMYQPSCDWPLYGTGCGLAASAFQVSGTLSAGSGQLLLNTNLTSPDTYFDQGYIIFTSGANTGVKRAIRQYVNAGGQILLFVPLPNPVVTGDAFNAFPGCDKTQSTCQNKFSNLDNFPAMPYTPIPEASV